MTNKEAIVHLKCIRNMALGDVMKEALTKAIEALEEQRPTAEWVVDEFGRKICGKCQFPFAEFQSTCYCSLCGAKMQEVAESCKELQRRTDNGSDQ